MTNNIHDLGKTLFLLEETISCPEDTFIRAVASAWNIVERRVVEQSSVLDGDFIATLHRTLASGVGASHPGNFVNEGQPTTWSIFVEEFDEYDENNILCGGDCWVLSHMYWGNHVPNLQFTVGWLCMNGVRIKHGYKPVFPPTEIHTQLRECLASAGPDCWDAESLRALTPSFREFETG